jgi:hypothetical protein
MRSTIVRCSACDRSLPLPATVGSGSIACSRCDQATGVWLFPALFREKSSTGAQQILDEGQSSCMSHPTKKAVAVCSGCGRFLCGLCDIDWGGDHLCSTCIGHRKQNDTDNELRSEYFHYDRVVMSMVLLSILLTFMGIGVFLVPVAIYVGWRYWSEPWRPVPHGKWLMIIALTLAFFVMLGLGAFLVFFLVNL